MSRVLISANLKCAYLDQVQSYAVSQNIPLGQALQNYATNIFSPSFLKGRIVSHQSGSGQSGSFEQASNNFGWNQAEVAALTWELRNLINIVIADGSFIYALDDGTQTPALVLAMMQNDLLNMGEGVTQQQGDWTSLNVPSIGGIPYA